MDKQDALKADPGGSGHEVSALWVYSDTGAVQQPVGEVYREYCGSHPGTDQLSNISYTIDDVATCGTFVTLPADAQQQWMAAAEQNPNVSVHDSDIEAVATICRGMPSAPMARAVNSTEAFGTPVSWTMETQLGYTSTAVLGWEGLGGSDTVVTYADPTMMGSPSTAKRPDWHVGAYCGFDAAKDAVAQASYLLTNTTAGQDFAPELKLALVSAGAGATTSAVVEMDYSDGGECLRPQDGGRDITFGIRALQPQKSDGFGMQGSIFIILRNYYSPRNPEGAVGELSLYSLQSRPSNSDTDPYVRTDSVTLPLSLIKILPRGSASPTP